MPANPYERDLRKVADPLRDETRKVRKTLLVWCLAAVAITLGQLFPTEVSALGLKITPGSRNVLLWLVALIVIYHLVAFAAYAASDFAHWYVNIKSTDWEDDIADWEKSKAEWFAKAKLSDEDRQVIDEHERRLGSIWRGEPSRVHMTVLKMIPPISIARALVDFLFPLAVGGVATYLLLRS